MNRHWLREDLHRGWPGADPLAQARAQSGQIVKHKDGRRTLRFTLAGHAFFLKYHTGVGWREIFRNLLQLRPPVIDARNEFRALQHLAAAGIPAPVAAGYGCRGINPARRESFVVSDAIENAPSLETLCALWRDAPLKPRCRRLLIEAVALLAARMHASGLNHRDFYLCHLLLDPGSLECARVAADIRVYLIDLHRAQIRSAVPPRWRAKDIGALYFSALHSGLGRQDRLRFLRAYFGEPLRSIVLRERKLLREAERRALAMQLKATKKIC